MNIFDSIILGAIQGVTEFLPISSSGHLILAREFLGISESGDILVFDVFIHVATALAIITYFWRDIMHLLKGLIEKNDISYRRKSWSLALAIIIGSIPAAIIGILFEDQIQSIFRSTSSMVWILLLGSILIASAELFVRKNNREVEGKISIPKGFVIGLFQTLALMPGMSRSGATISGGLFFGLSRSEAAKFSFLLGLPVMLGAGLLKTASGGLAMAGVSMSVLITGAITSFIVGLVSIIFLMKILKTKTLWMFIGYRLALVVVLLLLVL